MTLFTKHIVTGLNLLNLLWFVFPHFSQGQSTHMKYTPQPSTLIYFGARISSFQSFLLIETGSPIFFTCQHVQYNQQRNWRKMWWVWGNRCLQVWKAGISSTSYVVCSSGGVYLALLQKMQTDQVTLTLQQVRKQQIHLVCQYSTFNWLTVASHFFMWG